MDRDREIERKRGRERERERGREREGGREALRERLSALEMVVCAAPPSASSHSYSGMGWTLNPRQLDFRGRPGAQKVIG